MYTLGVQRAQKAREYMKSDKIVLGIDPGFSFTGYAVTQKEGGKTQVLEVGYLRLPQSQSLSARVGLFHKALEAKIVHWKVAHLGLETPFLGKNAQNFLKLGYLRGILYLLADTHQLQLHEFTPMQVKQSVTGFGGASKEQVARVLHSLFPALKQSDKYDATDALAVALSGLWNAEQQERMQRSPFFTQVR